MNNILWNHRWIYDRYYSDRNCLKDSFGEGIDQFASKASQHDYYDNDRDQMSLC